MIYDLVGNVLNLNNGIEIPTSTALPAGPTAQKFTYDDLYQLRTANGTHWPALTKRTSYTNSFLYDTIGNITQKVQTHLVIHGTDSATEPRETNYTLNYIYDPTGKPHAVTDAGDRLYTYDDNGNMLGWTSKSSGQRRTIVWNEENRVKSIADQGSTVDFLYDDTGERAVKRGQYGETVYVNRFYSIKNGGLGSKHVFAGDTRVVTKLEKDGGSIQSGVPGSIALVRSQGIYDALQQGSGQKKGIKRRLVSADGTTSTSPPIEKFQFFYHGDHLGSSSFITDDAGAVYQHLEYFPYGETWVEDGGSGQMPHYRFTGKELDPETGLYYYGARYYDPVLSRWISADPILGKYLPAEGEKEIENLPGMGGVFNAMNLNLFTYSHQNPVRYTDPDGRLSQSDRDRAIKTGRAEVALEGPYRELHAKLMELNPEMEASSPLTTYNYDGKKGAYLDCSGFSMLMIPQLKEGATAQYKQTTPLDVQKIIPGDLVFLKADKDSTKIADHVGVISEVFREKGKVTGYKVIQTSPSFGKSEVEVKLDDKKSVWNRAFVGFGTVDPKTDPKRPNSSITEKVGGFLKGLFKKDE